MTHTPPPPGGQYQGGQYQGGVYQSGQYHGNAQPAAQPQAQPAPPQAQPAPPPPPPYQPPPPPPPPRVTPQAPPAAYGSPPQYGAQPQHPTQPQHPAQPPYAAQPPYGAPPAGPDGAGYAAAAPPAKRRGKLFGAIGSFGGLGILATLALVAFRIFGGGGDDVPSVGECMNNSPRQVEVVDCSADNADWIVIGLDGTMTQQAFDDATEEEVCQNFPEWDNAFWFGPDTNNPSARGDIVCVARNR